MKNKIKTMLISSLGSVSTKLAGALSLLVLLFLNQSYAQVVEEFSSPGGGSWTVPCGVTSITVHLYGAGGGGGGSNTGGQTGGGGGAGGYASATYVVLPNQTFNFFIGTGGAAGSPGLDGGDGQASSWNGGVMTANGGTRGLGDNNGGAGGAGGTAFGGTTNIPGENGNTGGAIIGGHGGDTYGPYYGSGGLGGPSGIDGGNGFAYGGGGGGGGEKSGSSNPDGGTGANGGVVIEYTSTVTLPDAGSDLSSCLYSNLSGNTPDLGWTGTWSVIAGSATISNPNSPTSAISGIASGSCATFEWRFTSPGCIDRVDYVTICNPSICNDDPCGAIPLAVTSGSCSYTTYSNLGSTASTGMVEPGCGNYDGVDVWFSATVPANGQLEINSIDAPGGSTMYQGVALYTGPSCSNITSHHGCDYTTSTSSPAEITYLGTPGETVYIRVWNYFDYQSDFQICARTSPNAFGDIVPGSNSVTCGTPMTFMDPGGTGNYQVNSGGQYVLCPDTPGQYVSIDFSSGTNFFDVENGFDKLTILDGAVDSAGVLGQWSGTNNPGVITSSAADGCLTIQWQSDYIVTDFGWEATVTCSSTPGNNTYVCSPTNCSGGCGQWICMDGIYPTTNDGNGIEDLAIQNSGCFGAAGEVASKWFYFTVLTGGTIEFTFNGPNGQDYDFAVWGPSMDSIPPCPMSTGESPIRCSYAAVGNTGNPVGINQALGAGEAYEGVEGDGWVDALYVQPGETYAMILNIFMNGNPQPEIDLTIGGTGTIDCSPVFLPISLVSFDAINQGDFNYISWVTNMEMNNDFYTVESSTNGEDWTVVGYEDAVGNTQLSTYYSMRDHNPNFPVTYYRLKQTDEDGQFSYSKVVAVNTNRVADDFVTDLFPNPTNDFVTFTFNGKTGNSPLNVSIVNSLGSVVNSYNYTSIADGASVTLRTADLQMGTYHVVFEYMDRTVVQKLVIIK